MVVSEMGEQWSPQTAPARQADIDITPRGSPTGKIASTIGMRIPKVPQEVPVAKAMPQATRNMIAGRNVLSPAAFASAPSTNAEESRRFVIFLRVVAIVRIRIAGTIAIKPLGIHSIASLKVTRRRAIK